MNLKCKICGVSDLKTLKYIINHNYPPQFIGFIMNYPKSRRYIDTKKIKELIKIDKKKSLYVAVLVDPEKNILEEIKDLPFDYYQLYNCSVDKIRFIKNTYNKKIIVALTIEKFTDIEKYKLYNVKPGITGLSQIKGIDMSNPKKLAQSDFLMISKLKQIDYFKYLFLTLFGKGRGDQVKKL